MSLVTNPGSTTLPTSVDKGGNFQATLTYLDLAAGTVAATALAVTAFTTLANVQGVELDHIEVPIPFQDTADAANNSTLLTIGDAGSAARHLASTELNLNGTYKNLAYGTGTKYVPTADTPVLFTFTPPTGKTLAALKQGKLIAYFKIKDSRSLV